MDSLIKQVMSEIFDIPLKDINTNSSMDNISSWDSLGHLQLIIRLEEEFNITFNERDTLSMVNFESIEKILSKKHNK